MTTSTVDLAIKSDESLQFFPVDHQYIVEGVTIPSVTTILKSGGIGGDFSFVNPEKLEIARDRGSQLHEKIERYLKGMEEKEYCYDANLKFCYFLEFMNEYKPKILGSEVRLFSSKHMFAGTIDCVCEINNNISIIDFKTGKTKSRSFDIQLAAYESLLREKEDYKHKDINKYVLYLMEDTYQLKKVDECNTGEYVFLSALNIHNWKGGERA